MHSFLSLAFTLAVAPAARSPAHDALRTQCATFGADPHNAWALAHGITGIGRDFAASDGRRASEVIVHDFLEKSSKPGSGPYHFARFLADGTPAEPHAHLLTKTLVLAGLPQNTHFSSTAGPVTLGNLVASVEKDFRHTPGDDTSWRDVGWTLDLFGHVLKPGDSFTNGAGERVSIDAVMDDALAYLERAQADLSEGLAKGLPQVDKRKQGLYAHSCGGLHLVQAVLTWARFPEVRRHWGNRYAHQLALLFYRLQSESRQYTAALRAAPAQYQLLLRVQELKFYGHWLETLGRQREEAHFAPTPAQAQSIQQAKALLASAVQGLQELKAFESMAALKTSQPQTYLDLIGDACHATHGLDFWRINGRAIPTPLR